MSEAGRGSTACRIVGELFQKKNRGVVRGVGGRKEDASLLESIQGLKIWEVNVLGLTPGSRERGKASALRFSLGIELGM